MITAKLTNALNRTNVQKQLYIIFFIGIFIPLTIIGYYLVYNSRTLLFQHYEAHSQSDNLRTRSLLLDLTSNVYNKADILASDKELIRILSNDYDSPSEATQTITGYEGFNKILAQDPAIQQISIYTQNTTIPESPYIHQITEETRNLSWFDQAFTTVTPFWSKEVQTDRFHNESSVLSLHYRIFLPQINSYAIMNLTISTNFIKNRIGNSALETVLWLNDNQVFYQTGKASSDVALFDYKPQAGALYFGDIKLTDQNIIGCISSLSTSYSDDTFYIASLNYDGYPYMNKITAIHLGILLLILIMAGLFIYVYSGYFSRRVISLREAMHRASRGNYNIVDTFYGRDELSEAFADLNVMIQDIIQKESSVYEAQIRAQELANRQQQMEFQMLSSQINPHFLYNTLETIRMRSLKAGNTEVANAIKLLGKSMRYVLEHTTTSFTTIVKELDYIQTYLAIQKLRFHERVNYSLRINAQKKLDDYQIMPLLLQPIVENAILHGLRDIEQNGKIILHINMKDDTFYIDIFDNGCGMNASELAVMKQNIYNHPKDSSKSIGLYNIYQRIQLCYGIKYGIKVKSKKYYGTLFTLTIPAQLFKGGTSK